MADSLRKTEMPPVRRCTIDEYLALERAADERSTYIDGKIIAMAGETLAHGDITVNLTGLLFNHLKGTPCRALTKDSKLRSSLTPLPGTLRKGMFSYPDLMVVCGEVEFHDSFKDVILNPVAVVEVLSPSTEAFDRGEKFHRYRTWNPTVKDYVLVSQHVPRIEVSTAQEDGSWSMRISEGLEATATIPSISCTLKLADVYDRVVFPVDENDAESDAAKGPPPESQP